MGFFRHSYRVIIFGLSCFFLSSAALAGQWELPQLMELMAQVPASRASFTEKKYLAMLNAPLVLSGNLTYVRPARIEKQVLVPYEERFVVDGDTLTLENRAKGQKRVLALQSNPVAWAFVESMRATMAGDAATLRRFYQARLEGGRRQWLLSLEPRDSQMAGYVQTIKIGGAENRITSIEIQEAGGDRSVMTVTGDTP